MAALLPVLVREDREELHSTREACSEHPGRPTHSSTPPSENQQPLPVWWGEAGGCDQVLTERRQQEVRDLRDKWSLRAQSPGEQGA